MKKSILALILIMVICAIAVASWFVIQPSQINTTNISNNTNKSNTTLNSTLNNNTVSPDKNQNGNNNPPPPSSISADEAKDLAKKYVGPNVILGKPVMTTYKKVHAWQVPVYTNDHKFINNIYIDERTGQKVN